MARARKQTILKIPTHSRAMAGRKGRGLKFHDDKKCFKKISARFLDLFGRHGDIY